jgi:predicted metal-binding protein
MIRIKNGIPQIIDKETFEKVQALLEKRKLAPGANKAIQTYLLTGLIYCGKCGGRMVGHRKVAGREKNVYYSYECSNRTRLKNCTAKAINKEFIEKQVLVELDKKIYYQTMKDFGAHIMTCDDCNGYSRRECFFHSRKKAQNALDWIESMIIMNEMRG